MDVRKQMKITNFFLTISEWDRHIELTRQFVNAMDSFEPYAAYLRMNKGSGRPIRVKNLMDFLEENGFRAEKRPLKAVIRMFDTRMEDSLDFEDFLKMILTRDNPDLRFNAVNNPNYEVSYGEKLSEEIEYTMARFFHKASQFLKRIMDDQEVQMVIEDDNLFKIVDVNDDGTINFENLKAFFSRSKIALREGEMVSILRAIDINDDGCINEEEFEYFLSLFKGEDPDITIITALKQRSTSELNFFGEKSRSRSRDSGSAVKKKDNYESAVRQKATRAKDIGSGIRMQYISRRWQDKESGTSKPLRASKYASLNKKELPV